MNDMKLSYDVKLYKTEIYHGAKRTSYRVRWSVAGKSCKEVFYHTKLAGSFLSKLTTAAREGVPFDVESGLPLPMAKELHRRSWYKHACEYIDMKWPHISPGHRRGISETLTQATLSLLSGDRGKPSDESIRRALHGWAFSKTARNGAAIADAVPPEGISSVVHWLEENTVDLSEFEKADVTRKVLDKLAIRQDGKAVAPNTSSRRRGPGDGVDRIDHEELQFDGVL